MASCNVAQHRQPQSKKATFTLDMIPDSSLAKLMLIALPGSVNVLAAPFTSRAWVNVTHAQSATTSRPSQWATTTDTCWMATTNTQSKARQSAKHGKLPLTSPIDPIIQLNFWMSRKKTKSSLLVGRLLYLPFTYSSFRHFVESNDPSKWETILCQCQCAQCQRRRHHCRCQLLSPLMFLHWTQAQVHHARCSKRSSNQGELERVVQVRCSLRNLQCLHCRRSYVDEVLGRGED